MLAFWVQPFLLKNLLEIAFRICFLCSSGLWLLDSKLLRVRDRSRGKGYGSRDPTTDLYFLEDRVRGRDAGSEILLQIFTF